MINQLEFKELNFVINSFYGSFILRSVVHFRLGNEAKNIDFTK